MTSRTPAASVVITTRNRKEELRQAARSALEQSAPVEVIVVDDGSTDGTSEMLRAEFPTLRVERFETSVGYVARRNHGAEIAQAPYIFSIDDDAIFSTPFTVEETLREFSDPRIGAVAIPFINVQQDTILRQHAPDGAVPYAVNWYIGTAHAVRRDVFLKLGGYRTLLVHQGEELDYCIRMLAAGYVVRLGTADAVHHFESPRRSFERMHYYGRRNNILFAWQNLPFPEVGLHLVSTTVRGLWSGLRRGELWPMLRGTARGFLDIAEGAERHPVHRKAYRLFRELVHPRALAEFEAELPPPILPTTPAA